MELKSEKMWYNHDPFAVAHTYTVAGIVPDAYIRPHAACNIGTIIFPIVTDEEMEAQRGKVNHFKIPASKGQSQDLNPGSESGSAITQLLPGRNLARLPANSVALRCWICLEEHSPCSARHPGLLGETGGRALCECLRLPPR